MKKLLFAAGILVVGLGAAYAQSKVATPQTQQAQKQTERTVQAERKMDPKVIADRKTERMEKALELTPDQKAKIHAIYLEDAQQAQGRAALRQQTNEQVKAVLTEDQVQKMDAADAARKEKMKSKMQKRKAYQKAAPGEVQPK